MEAIDNVKKYIDFVFDRESFGGDLIAGNLSPEALDASGRIRGDGYAPALFLHGIMKRSGTVYVGDLLGLHPDLCAYPGHLWEIPFLARARDVLDLQQRFFRSYNQNRARLGEHDFLLLFGSAIMGYLHSLTPPEHRALLKIPGVEYLNYFPVAFPHEQLLLLVRDGRDVVNSTARRWGQLRFSDICRRWNRSAQMVLRVDRELSGREGYWLARFEDAVRDPEGFVATACTRFQLDAQRYPYDRIASLPLQGSSMVKKDGKVAYWATKPPDFNPVGRWQRWSRRQKQIFKSIAGQNLIELGYCRNLEW